MPLPNTSDHTWPPVSMEPMYSKMAEWAAWYSGEPERIIQVYASQSQNTGQVPWWRFWSRARAGQDGAQRALLHVPIASDLAAVSGSLLFGERARIRIRAERLQAKPPADPGTDPGAAPSEPEPVAETPESKSEKRLLEIIEEGGVHARLVEAAESAAAIGGVYIYPVWDKDLRDFPIMAVAQSDMAVPEFSHGILTAVTFHRVIEKVNGEVLRHLERHEVEGTGETRKAVVLNGLFKGTDTKLGTLTDIRANESTARIQPRVELPFSVLDVEYVPNMLPNRLWRASSLGIADIQGSETLLDGVDETYASWMRDVRLAKARILVPREYLRQDPTDKTAAASFDIDHEIYVGMDMEPGLTQDARAMLAHQFEIRYLEHRETAKDFVQRIVSNAGYTPAAAGESSDVSRTGTALRVSERKTLLTLRKKSGWWTAAVANTLHRMMIIDKVEFSSGVEAFRPTVTLSDSIIDQPLELAQTALALKTAESASIETRVRIVNPDWSETEIDAEVKRVQGDIEAAKPPAPVITGGKFGSGDAADTGHKPTDPMRQGGADGPPPPPQPGAKPK